MKGFLAILIVFSVLLQSTSKFIILVNFQSNQEYIATNICEKRAEANNCCKGKCYLKEQFKKDEQNEKTPYRSSVKDKNEVHLFAQDIRQIEFYSNSSVLEKLQVYEAVRPVSYFFSIFHPPQGLKFS